MADRNEGGGNQAIKEPGSQAGLYAHLGTLVKNLDPSSTRLPKLTKLIEELRSDEERLADPCPSGGQQPYPLDKQQKRFSFRQILEWLGLVPKKTTQPESAVGEYQQRNVTHYGEAFNVDLGGSMMESEVENKRAYYNERQEELRQRYEGRPANFAGPLYDSELDLVPKMLGAYKRREQEYQWRQPGSQFRREVLESQKPVIEEPEECLDERQITVIGQLETLKRRLEENDCDISYGAINDRLNTLYGGLSELNQLADEYPCGVNKTNPYAINSLIQRYDKKIEELTNRAAVVEKSAEKIKKKKACPAEAIRPKEPSVKTDFLGLAQNLLRLPWKDGVHADEAKFRLIQLEIMVDALTTARDNEWAIDHDEVARSNANKVIQALRFRIDAIKEQHKPVGVKTLVLGMAQDLLRLPWKDDHPHDFKASMEELETMIVALTSARESACASDEDEELNHNITEAIEAVKARIDAVKERHKMYKRKLKKSTEESYMADKIRRDFRYSSQRNEWSTPLHKIGERFREVQETIQRLNTLALEHPSVGTIPGLIKIFKIRLFIIYHRFDNAMAAGIVDGKGNPTEEYTDEEARLSDAEAKEEVILLYKTFYPAAQLPYAEQGDDYIEEEEECTEEGPEYTEEGPEYAEEGPEYTEEEPKYTEEGPECTEEGPEYTEEEPKYTEEGPECTMEGPEYIDAGPDYAEEEEECTEKGPDDKEEEPKYTDAVPEYTEEGPEYAEEGPEYAEEVPVDTEEGPECTDAGPDYAEEGPEYTEEGPECTEEGPECTDAGPKCTEEGPECTEEGPECTEEGPECTEEGEEDADVLSDDSDDVAAYTDQVAKEKYLRMPKGAAPRFNFRHTLSAVHNKIEDMWADEELDECEEDFMNYCLQEKLAKSTS